MSKKRTQLCDNPADSTMPPGQPATIGRYTVQRVLGRGGMGTVYLAVDPLIEREVAIKVLPLAGADEYSDRLIAEARVSGRLIHPNIVGVFDIGEEQGQPFVVMPYVPGRTVASILTDRDRPAIGTKLRWMAQLCDALAYAHERRVIHRDIKPTNLLIDDQQNLRVLDFGIAKVLTTSQIQFTSVGTPAYMAPEQYSSDPVDPRTDVFSAGLVLYELLTHRRALTGTTPAQIYGQLMAGPPPRVLAAAPDADPALAAVCERAMSRDPNDRFQTARAFGDALLEAQAAVAAVQDTTTVTVVGLVSSRSEPVSKPEPVAPAPAPLAPPTAQEAVPAPVPTTVRVPPPLAAAAPPSDAAQRHEQDDPELVVDELLAADALAAPAARPLALALAVVGLIAVIALATWYIGASGSVVPLGTWDPARRSDATPDVGLRPTPDWVRGPQGTGCPKVLPDHLRLTDYPLVAFYVAPTACAADGTPISKAIFRETPDGKRMMWVGDLAAEMGPGVGFYTSADAERVLVSERTRWTFIDANGMVETHVNPAPGVVIAVSPDCGTVIYAAENKLSFFDRATRQAEVFLSTTDGRAPTEPVYVHDVTAGGRFVVFASKARNLTDGSTAGTNALYRFDRAAIRLAIVDADVGKLDHATLRQRLED